MKNELINAKNLTRVFKRGSEDIYALKNVDLSIQPGEFISIVGPSGSGKSTLLHMLGLIDRPSGGSLVVNGQHTEKLAESELVKLRRKNIGFIFQQFLLLPTLTVKENIALPLLFSREPGREKRIEELVKLMGLGQRANHLPHQLSGGEMQRVSIGRALVNEPKLLLADEPTGNLDSATSGTIFELFKKINAGGITLVVVTHNADLAGLAQRVIRVRDGELLEREPARVA
jgi:ABC-type lipoprotein export system ATPase subunit